METSRTIKLFTRWLLAAIVLLTCTFALVGCTQSQPGTTATQNQATSSAAQATSESGSGIASEPASSVLEVAEDGSYTSKDEIAAYIHEFGHLPGNFISKTKAKKAGWVSSKGNLDVVCPGKSIGGGTFYNDDGLLPDAPGRSWKECDVGYTGGFRGAERIVFSNDGLVYYTDDHYRTFEKLY